MTTPAEKHILLLEDEKPMAKALQIKLERFGYKVTTVSNGLLGLEAIDKTSFDLILCDLIMPKMDGFAVLEELQTRNNSVPIIVMTNLSQEEDEARARSLGAREYIVKSDTPIADIMELVNKTISS